MEEIRLEDQTYMSMITFNELVKKVSEMIKNVSEAKENTSLVMTLFAFHFSQNILFENFLDNMFETRKYPSSLKCVILHIYYMFEIT